MEKEFQVIINREKCIGCGRCCGDCPSHVLELQDGKAVWATQRCLQCCHCVAICPTAAVSVGGYEMKDVVEFAQADFGVEAERLLNTIKGRRSVRHYQNRPIEKRVIEKIIEAGRFTPTGANRQGVRYIVLQDTIAQMEQEGLKLFRRLKGLAEFAGRWIKLPYDLSKYTLEPGFFFHGAPAVILIVSRDTVDASLAAMSMELMAEALGLGTLYVGFFAAVAQRNREMQRVLGLGKKERVVTCLAIGYPDVRYLRTVPRRKASVQWQ